MLMMDSHAHIISDDADRYPPSPPSGKLDPAALASPMTIDRLIAEMDATGVAQAVIVQRGSIYGFDNSYVCDSGARFPDRLRVVCSIDAARADSAEQVHRWISKHGAAGIRLMELVRSDDIGWLDGPSPRQAWEAAADLGAPVCVHLFPWNRAAGLNSIASIVESLPNLTVVIDHFGAMRSDAGPPDHGVDESLEKVARYDGVNVKFTTIPLGRLHDANIDAAPVVQRVMDLFGAERMMWGSDITQSPGSYAEMVELGRQSVRLLSSSQQEQLLGGTAARVYGA